MELDVNTCNSAENIYKSIKQTQYQKKEIQKKQNAVIVEKYKNCILDQINYMINNGIEECLSGCDQIKVFYEHEYLLEEAVCSLLHNDPPYYVEYNIETSDFPTYKYMLRLKFKDDSQKKS